MRFKGYEGAGMATLFLGLWALVACSEAEPTRSTAVPMQPISQAERDGMVGAANAAPRIQEVSLEPAQPRAGDAVRAIVRSSDPDGDPVQHRFVWSLRGRELASLSNQVELSAGRKGQKLELEVTASDGRLESAPFRVTTRLGNRPPRLDGVTIDPPGEIVGGRDVTVRPVAHDRDGDRLDFLYVWHVNGRRISSKGPVLSTRELGRGDMVKVSVKASDGRDESNEIVSPELRVGNAPPRVSSFPDGTGADGAFRYRLEAEDPDGDNPLRFRLVAGPKGMTVSSGRGEVNWLPGAADAGRHGVTVEVDDLHGGKVQHRFEVIVGLDEGGGSPAAPR